MTVMLGAASPVEVAVDGTCVDADAFARAMPQLPAGTRVELIPSEDARRVRLRVALPDKAGVAALERELAFEANGCAQLTAISARIIERYVDDLPAEVWKPEAREAQTPPRPATPTRPTEPAPLTVHPGLLLRVASDVDQTLRVGPAGTASFMVPVAPAARVGAFVDGRAGWQLPVAYGPGTVQAFEVVVGAGVEGRVGVLTTHLGARGGGFVAFGEGFDANASSLAPSAELVVGIGASWWGLMGRLDLEVPLIRHQFRAPGLPAQTSSPVLFALLLGAEFDIPLGTDPPAGGNSLSEPTP